MISIHAPTRGATKVHPDKRQVRSISIHAPTRGATSSSLCCCTYSRISIHAPTRGATTIITRSLLILVFQSTLPQGERPNSRTWFRWFTYFNPRSHKGSDFEGNVYLSFSGDFNPRSHKGSDGADLSAFKDYYYFNPRSHKGSDCYKCA